MIFNFNYKVNPIFKQVRKYLYGYIHFETIVHLRGLRLMGYCKFSMYAFFSIALLTVLQYNKTVTFNFNVMEVRYENKS